MPSLFILIPDCVAQNACSLMFIRVGRQRAGRRKLEFCSHRQSFTTYLLCAMYLASGDMLASCL